MYIDVHCHLDMLENSEKVVSNAKKKSVMILTDGIDVETNRKSLELSEKYENVFPCLGIYPDEALKMKDSGIDKEIEFILKNKEKISGIGEVGMDFSGDLSRKNPKRQEVIFRKFIELSQKIEKPIVVHSRKAEKECIEILEDMNTKKVVMHYFSGNFKLVKRIVGNGWFLSIPTAVKNSEHFQKVIQEVPIENLLCETDSPYSHPDKKFPNEPVNVLESYKMISKIKGLSLKEVEKEVQNNFDKLFGNI